ncbi:MAG: helix-turn-helix domain-containing protein [Candidatus Bilamarchaeaceae archaeon]
MLKKKEVVYRYILTEALERKQLSFTQLSLSRMFGISLSTVSNALKPLEKIGAIEKRTRSFNIIDIRKALSFWATARNMAKDIVYSARSDLPVQKIEAGMPAEVVFTAYSGYRFLYNEAPADYGEIYVYADKKALEGIKERFPETKGSPNVFVLEKDAFMPEGNIAPIPQIYVDLWNLKEWYARDYLVALERRLFK